MPLSHQRLELKRQDLLVEPYTFLRRNLFYATGQGAPAASAIVPVHLFESRDGQGTRPGFYMRSHTQERHAADNLMIQCMDPNLANGIVRTLENALFLQVVRFDAHWVATTFYPDPQNAAAPFPWYLLPNQGGAAMMFTQRLTGCSFLYRQVAAGTEVAHIMPTPPELGIELEARLREFFNDPTITIYGRSRYNEERETTIVGVRNANGRWKIYAQKRDRNTRDMRSIHRI